MLKPLGNRNGCAVLLTKNKQTVALSIRARLGASM